MNSLLDLNAAVKVRNCTTQYFDEVQLSHRIIYSDVFDWILERANGIKDVYGKVCFLYNALKRCLGIDLQKIYGEGSRDGNFWRRKALMVLCFLLMKRRLYLFPI